MLCNPGESAERNSRLSEAQSSHTEAAPYEATVRRKQYDMTARYPDELCDPEASDHGYDSEDEIDELASADELFKPVPYKVSRKEV
jgi:hypothetical protein